MVEEEVPIEKFRYIRGEPKEYLENEKKRKGKKFRLNTVIVRAIEEGNVKMLQHIVEKEGVDPKTYKITEKKIKSRNSAAAVPTLRQLISNKQLSLLEIAIKLGNRDAKLYFKSVINAGESVEFACPSSITSPPLEASSFFDEPPNNDISMIPEIYSKLMVKNNKDEWICYHWIIMTPFSVADGNSIQKAAPQISWLLRALMLFFVCSEDDPVQKNVKRISSLVPNIENIPLRSPRFVDLNDHLCSTLMLSQLPIDEQRDRSILVRDLM